MDFSIRPKTAAEQAADRIAAEKDAGLQAATESAQGKYRAQQRAAMRLQLNDKAAEFGGFAS